MWELIEVFQKASKLTLKMLTSLKLLMFISLNCITFSGFCSSLNEKSADGSPNSALNVANRQNEISLPETTFYVGFCAAKKVTENKWNNRNYLVDSTNIFLDNIFTKGIDKNIENQLTSYSYNRKLIRKDEHLKEFRQYIIAEEETQQTQNEEKFLRMGRTILKQLGYTAFIFIISNVNKYLIVEWNSVFLQ